ncbi:unnamed protein product, partial [Allacma fusca]
MGIINTILVGERDDEIEEIPKSEIDLDETLDAESDGESSVEELMKGKEAEDGATLRGTTVEDISKSIPRSKNNEPTCTLKLTNFLTNPLTKAQ